MDNLLLRREKERERIIEVTAIERLWWTIEKKYINSEEALKAVSRDEMVVMPRYGNGYRLISILDGKEGNESNLIRKVVFYFISEVFSTWHSRLLEEDKNIYLAITSLYRSLADQIKINKSSDSYRSTDGTMSSHIAGASFDVSMRSYYCYEDNQWKPIRSWQSGEKELFRKQPIQLFLEILDFQEAKNNCNVVIEKDISESGAFDSVIHVCVNPDYEHTVY